MAISRRFHRDFYDSCSGLPSQINFLLVLSFVILLGETPVAGAFQCLTPQNICLRSERTLSFSRSIRPASKKIQISSAVPTSFFHPLSLLSVQGRAGKTTDIARSSSSALFLAWNWQSPNTYGKPKSAAKNKSPNTTLDNQNITYELQRHENRAKLLQHVLNTTVKEKQLVETKLTVLQDVVLRLKQNATSSLTKQRQQLEEQHAATIKQLQGEWNGTQAKLQLEHESELARVQKEHEQDLLDMKQSTLQQQQESQQEALTSFKRQLDTEKRELQEETARTCASLKEQLAQMQASLHKEQQRHARQLEKERALHEVQQKEVRDKWQTKLTRLEQEWKDKLQDQVALLQSQENQNPDDAEESQPSEQFEEQLAIAAAAVQAAEAREEALQDELSQLQEKQGLILERHRQELQQLQIQVDKLKDEKGQYKTQAELLKSILLQQQQKEDERKSNVAIVAATSDSHKKEPQDSPKQRLRWGTRLWKRFRSKSSKERASE